MYIYIYLYITVYFIYVVAIYIHMYIHKTLFGVQSIEMGPGLCYLEPMFFSRLAIPSLEGSSRSLNA